MKSLLFGHFLLLSLGTYASESCVAQKIYLDATYAQVTAPLLDQWSEASGNLTGIHVRAKETYQTLGLTFHFTGERASETKSYQLKRNKLQELDFEKVLKEIKETTHVRPNKLTISVYKNQGKLCEQEMLIIEQDPQDGVLKNP